MVNLKRSVGYVQISLGLMLIFACMIGYDILSSHASKLYDATDMTLSKVFYNTGLTPSNEQMITGLQIKSYSTITTNFVIQAFIVLTFILAVMMMLQGVANTRLGSKEDIPPAELGKFVTALFLIIYVIAALYVLIFKSAQSERAINAIYMLIIMAILVIIARISQSRKKKAKA